MSFKVKCVILKPFKTDMFNHTLTSFLQQLLLNMRAIFLDDIKICFAIEGKKQELSSSCKTAIAYFGTDDSSLAPILSKNFATTSTFSLSRGGGGGRLNQFGILLSLRKKGEFYIWKGGNIVNTKKSSHIKCQWLFLLPELLFSIHTTRGGFFWADEKKMVLTKRQIKSC